MQALILCRENIGGIGSNPEGYVVHTLHLDRAFEWSWCVLPLSFSHATDMFPRVRNCCGGD